MNKNKAIFTKPKGGISLSYEKCVEDVIMSDSLFALKQYKHHGGTRLDHSINVSQKSYTICKKLRLDYAAAARGGLLHDYFFYDYHKTKFDNSNHVSFHPKAALARAEKEYNLSKREKDIIVKHMWPLTLRLPRYPESYIVSAMDKICAVEEVCVATKCKLKKRTKPALLRARMFLTTVL